MPATEDIIDLLMGDDDKDGVDELISNFIDKVEAKLNDIDQGINRSRLKDQNQLQEHIEQS